MLWHWGTLQIRIQFVRQSGNGGKHWYPLLPLKQTNECVGKMSIYMLGEKVDDKGVQCAVDDKCRKCNTPLQNF